MMGNVVSIKIGSCAEPRFHTWVKIKRRVRGTQVRGRQVYAIRLYHNVSRASMVRALRCQWAFTRTPCAIVRFSEVNGEIRYPPKKEVA